MSKTDGGCAIATSYLIFLLFWLVSWAINLVQFCKSDFDAPYKREIVKGIGVFVPTTSLVTVWCCNGPEKQNNENRE